MAEETPKNQKKKKKSSSKKPTEQTPPTPPPAIPFRKPYVTNGVLMDVDPDRTDIFDRLREIVQISVPVRDICGDTDWRRDDKKYFFDHPGTVHRIRPTTDDERLMAEETAIRLGGIQSKDLELKYGPFFRLVLVGNISPGFRVRVSIDNEARDPEQVAVFNGWLGPGIPAYVPFPGYMENMHGVWVEALQLHAEDAP